MLSPRRLLTNATLVTPTETLTQGSLLIERGKISALGTQDELADGFAADLEIMDLKGAYVLPGLIDLHTDTLEKEITPRPSADFPITVAMQELDRKLVACGITTVFHSLHFGYQEAEVSNRSRFSRRDVVEGLHAMASRHTLAHTRLHARYEVVGHGPQARELVGTLVKEGLVHLLSFMDHTPGQGQYTRERFIAQRAREGMTEAQAVAALAEKQQRPRLSWAEMRDVAEVALARGVPLASHDDDSREKVQQMHDLGVTICEFPINQLAAEAARSLGMTVLGGASNVLRGGSLTGNLDVLAAMRAGVVDGLCSDYYPPSMLHAVFKLWRERVLPLPQAVAAATRVPAIAAGLGDLTGSLEVGKAADLIVVCLEEDRPVVIRTFVDGENVHSSGRERSVRREMVSLAGHA